MPTLKFYGDRPPVPGARQVPTVPATKAASPPIQTDRYFRNGKPPDASVFSSMNEAMNQAMLYRTKEVFSYCGVLGAGGGLGVSSAGAGSRIRWRFAFHTSPYAHALFCRAFMYPQSAGFNSNAFAAMDITNAAGAVLTTANFYYGTNPLQTANVAGWQYMKIVDKFIDLSAVGLAADTDYYGLVYDGDNGLIQSIAVADIQSMSENYAGYLPQNFTQESLILDEYRQNLVAPMPTLWKRGGAKVLNFTVDNSATSPRTIAVNTATNIIDSSSTTYGASIPGYTLDMTGKARLSQSSGCPCVMKVYVSCTSAANGVVHLRDSAGTIVATCTNTGGAGVAGWIASAAFNLPANSSKYYLTHQTAAGTLSTHAVSIYEYELVRGATRGANVFVLVLLPIAWGSWTRSHPLLFKSRRLPCWGSSSIRSRLSSSRSGTRSSWRN